MLVVSDFGRCSNWLVDFLLVVVGVAIFPADALAWGPATHLDFSMQLLSGAAVLVPTVRRLVTRRKRDFIYGSLAADSVVGKNRASNLTHCHSWNVALQLLEEARTVDESHEAFVLGYLSHLGADVVAHNRFVPDRVVAHYRALGVGHLYWEARFDNRLVYENPKVHNLWKSISRESFPKFDRFLADRLEPTLFSHRISSNIYHRSLGVQRNRPWCGLFNHIDVKSKFTLGHREVYRWRKYSVAMAAQVLNDPHGARLHKYDPTGYEALRVAETHRRVLRLSSKTQEHPHIKKPTAPEPIFPSPRLSSLPCVNLRS
jgi:hypothetical protein